MRDIVDLFGLEPILLSSMNILLLVQRIVLIVSISQKVTNYPQSTEIIQIILFV